MSNISLYIVIMWNGFVHLRHDTFILTPAYIATLTVSFWAGTIFFSPKDKNARQKPFCNYNASISRLNSTPFLACHLKIITLNFFWLLWRVILAHNSKGQNLIGNFDPIKQLIRPRYRIHCLFIRKIKVSITNPKDRTN